MTNRDIQINDLEALRKGFIEFLNANYSQLTYKGIICSEAFYIFREGLGLEPMEVLFSEEGIEK